jgi:hypothetical protein
MKRHQLIICRIRGLCGRARLGCTDDRGLRSHVDHDDLVAEAVHFDERVVSEDAHRKLVLSALIWKPHV